jgi:hypothetical protein
MCPSHTPPSPSHWLQPCLHVHEYVCTEACTWCNRHLNTFASLRNKETCSIPITHESCLLSHVSYIWHGAYNMTYNRHPSCASTKQVVLFTGFCAYVFTCAFFRAYVLTRASLQTKTPWHLNTCASLQNKITSPVRACASKCRDTNMNTSMNTIVNTSMHTIVNTTACTTTATRVLIQISSTREQSTCHFSSRKWRCMLAHSCNEYESWHILLRSLMMTHACAAWACLFSRPREQFTCQWSRRWARSAGWLPEILKSQLCRRLI